MSAAATTAPVPTVKVTATPAAGCASISIDGHPASTIMLVPGKSCTVSVSPTQCEYNGQVWTFDRWYALDGSGISIADPTNPTTEVTAIQPLAGYSADVTANFTAPPLPASVRVVSYPDGAPVTVNGEYATGVISTYAGAELAVATPATFRYGNETWYFQGWRTTATSSDFEFANPSAKTTTAIIAGAGGSSPQSTATFYALYTLRAPGPR
ncbi:MAG: hypothetical protein ACREB9_04930 [Thermoplasmata archaeon]